MSENNINSTSKTNLSRRCYVVVVVVVSTEFPGLTSPHKQM